MAILDDIVNKEKKCLQDRIEYLEGQLVNPPEGRLRISTHRGKADYYHITEPGDLKGKYISRKDSSLPIQLAQKGYNTSVLDGSKRNLKALEDLQKNYRSDYLDDIYNDMSAARQKLVTPVVMRDEEFIKNWYEKHPGNLNPLEAIERTYTSRGEVVRSKTEKILADEFFKLGIPYVYESRLTLKGYKTIYPDFLLLNVRTRKSLYWEHYGMMDDPQYYANAIMRTEAYECNGYWRGHNLITTHEAKDSMINTKYVERIIERYLL